MKQLKIQFLFIFSLLIVINSSAQLLDPKKGSLFADQPFFNHTFVKSAKIKRIVGEYSYKKVGEPIKASKEYYAIEFDESGRMVSTEETRKNDGTKDNNWVLFSYSENNQLVTVKKGRKESLAGKEFHYTKQGICDEEITFVALDKNGVQTKEILYSETIKINLAPNKLQRIYFNNYALPYLTETTILDSNGRTIEKIEEFTVSQQALTTYYSYSEKGNVVAIKKTNSEQANATEEIRFQYDEFGNVTQQLTYKNGDMVTEISYLYNAKTHFLVNLIQRDVATNSLVLLRFQPYEFFF